MAVVLAKNTVGSNWRKTLGSREWVRVPAAEQAAVRGAVLQLLLTEPSDRWVGSSAIWQGQGGLLTAVHKQKQRAVCLLAPKAITTHDAVDSWHMCVPCKC